MGGKLEDTLAQAGVVSVVVCAQAEPVAKSTSRLRQRAVLARLSDDKFRTAHMATYSPLRFLRKPYPLLIQLRCDLAQGRRVIQRPVTRINISCPLLSVIF